MGRSGSFQLLIQSPILRSLASMASDDDVFDVRQWLHRNRQGAPPPTYTIDGPVSPGWTKTSANTYKHGDNSGLSKLQLPTYFPLDLNQWKGDRYIPPHSDGAGVEIIIRELLSSSEITTITSAFHIVTFRNNLNKILGTLVDQREDWIIDGCIYNNSSTNSTLYLDIVKVKSDFEDTKDGQRFIRWGRAFEAACTGEHVADSNKEYGVALSSTLGAIKLCIGAEIDCYDDDCDDDDCDGGGGKEEGKEVPRLSSLVEMKTFRLPSHAKQWHTVYRWKHPKWWLQSYLAGVERLVLGARDEQVRSGLAGQFSAEFVVFPLIYY